MNVTSYGEGNLQQKTPSGISTYKRTTTQEGTNTELVPGEQVCQGNLQLGSSVDEGCLERSERSRALIALAYESGLGEKNLLGFGMLEAV